MSGPDAFRLCAWLDTSKLDAPELPIRHGIEARVSPRVWVHCARDGDVLLFDKVEDAEAELKRLRARLAEGQP